MSWVRSEYPISNRVFEGIRFCWFFWFGDRLQEIDAHIIPYQPVHVHPRLNCPDLLFLFTDEVKIQHKRGFEMEETRGVGIHGRFLNVVDSRSEVFLLDENVSELKTVPIKNEAFEIVNSRSDTPIGVWPSYINQATKTWVRKPDSFKAKLLGSVNGYLIAESE